MPRLRLLLVSLITMLTLPSCQSPAPSSVATQTPARPQATAHPARDPAQAEYWATWEQSSHAHTYALEKGPNTYCAKCHSPANWDPMARIDDPPNCVSCKFAFESSTRIAKDNPLVPEHDWVNIDCAVCHRVEDGIADSVIAWHNTTTGYYESVVSTTGLCEKCHLDNATLRHKRELGGGAHAGFECTDCHDPHTTRAGCADCHDAAAISDVSPGHDPAHAVVTCAACHDASGLEVAPLEDDGVWMPFRTGELLGRVTREPYQSHNLQLSVDCTRCHFRGNPWGLNEEP